MCVAQIRTKPYWYTYRHTAVDMRPIHPLLIDDTMKPLIQEIKLRDPRLDHAQAEATASVYYARVCGKPNGIDFEGLGEVLLRLENNQHVLVQRCEALAARVKELEDRKRRRG